MSEDELRSIAGAPDGPAFAAPWEATAFALRGHLVERGIVEPATFAALLGEELRKDHAAQDAGTAYFVAFVAALERAVAHAASADRLAAERAAWRDAARATPHGRPITLPPREAPAGEG